MKRVCVVFNIDYENIEDESLESLAAAVMMMIQDGADSHAANVGKFKFALVEGDEV